MALTPLYELAARMQLLRLHCTFAFQQGGNLPAFKGSMLHGWLGHQLLKQDKPLYNLLYAEHGQQQPKPYAIACHDHRTAFPEQATLSVEITLFGSATQVADRLVHALSTHPLGLGSQRLRISLQSMASHTPQGLRLGVHTLPLAAWLRAEPVSMWQDCVLQLTSPLRIKQKGRIVRHEVPSLSLLLSQVQRRLALITAFWVDDDPAWQDVFTHPVPLGDHRTLKSPLYFEDWQRYSRSRQELLPFGGVMGELCYQGDIYHALEWLQVGQFLQLGGKTTFGLGCYRLLQ